MENLSKIHFDEFLDLMKQCRFSDAYSKTLLESAQTCLLKSGHQDCVTLQAIGTYSNTQLEDVILKFSVDFDLNASKNTYTEQPEATGFGAVFLSLLYIYKIKNLVPVVRTYGGDGVDWYLGTLGSGILGLDATLKNKLEISGIFKETPGNSVKKRLKEKWDQANGKTKGQTTPALVSIIEFSVPIIALKDKNDS